MRSGSWSKILWTAALLPLLGVSVLPTQLRTLICRVTGAVMATEACCPGSSGAPEAPAADSASAGVSGSISDAGCCVARTIDLGKLVAERRAEGAPPPVLALGSVGPAVGVALPARPRSRVRQDRPPPVGPPLVLLKRSFLI